MIQFDVNNFLRDNIRNLVPYSSARADFNGEALIFLDANENNLGGKYNRYPDPLQQKLKMAISELKGIPIANIFIGNGSDEPIDLLIRAFCVPGRDKIIVLPPTYGMYAVAANVNDVEVIEVPLHDDFSIRTNGVLNSIDQFTKLVFICSPNNPSGNLMAENDLELILKNFQGIIVIDEAYLDFSGANSWVDRLSEYPNLVVLQTFSKAWGLAGLRIGTAYASEEIINVLSKIKPPYNVSEITQQLACDALINKDKVAEWAGSVISQRESLAVALQKFSFIDKIYPSDANFLLVKVIDAGQLYAYLAKEGIVVRNRSSVAGCENCLRITIGTLDENKILLDTLNKY